ncbi:MAG: ELM1/GtrOC1 family putative glycosyltransferase [Sulfurovaceae bacterium]|nr:ELM1/GtrOC1 family putative glycosyltransferase [Sulfurovaceae bacterium]MDD5548521.1 ELM1/GtrOC1 family putative glycosyltransferase [Sulfurovaceae bacterium]
MSKALIFSDGKKGHLNQSIAFCKFLNLEYDIVDVKFKNRFFKLLSYLFDRVGFYNMSILDMSMDTQVKPEYDEFCHSCEGRNPEITIDNQWIQSSLKNKKYNLAVCAGSGTYYASKVIAKKFKIKSVSMMLPRGYKYDFDVIFAQSHDNPPVRPNIIEIPANFSYIQPSNIYKPKKQSVGIVIGGNNSYLYMDKDKLKFQLDFIQKQFKDYEIAVTTSPRTPREIEDFIKSYKFGYEIIYSKNPINPIPDFLENCKTVFITSDSTSMISESISFGKANIVILPLVSKKENKFNSFISKLENDGYLHIFNGKIENKNKKIDFRKFVKGIKI